MYFCLRFGLPLLILIGQLTCWTHEGLCSSCSQWQQRLVKFSPVAWQSLSCCASGCGRHSWCDKIFSRAREDSRQGPAGWQSHLPQTARAGKIQGICTEPDSKSKGAAFHFWPVKGSANVRPCRLHCQQTKLEGMWLVFYTHCCDTFGGKLWSHQWYVCSQGLWVTDGEQCECFKYVPWSLLGVSRTCC